MTTRALAFLLPASLIVAACSGGKPAPNPQPAPTSAATAAPTTADTGKPAADPAPAPAPAPEPVAAPDKWSDSLSHKEKSAFMKAHVMPKMAEVFKAYDAERYATFGCATCHGKPWNDHPKDFLPKLTKSGAPQGKKGDPKFGAFMGKQVKPAMAKIFGKEPWSKDNPDGFGCTGCHVME